ncbi:hypothetical protein HDU67_003552 [Dinochytrium kinnereticum]|nr:hypothetical protein HDU67_003552 [Dinochytrium kinnereticum]
MASVLIGLTALAVYRYVKNRRGMRTPEMMLINRCFPNELQQQILNDFDECISTFTASRYDKHQRAILLLKQQQILAAEEAAASITGLDGDALTAGSVESMESDGAIASVADAEPPKPSRFSFLFRKKPGTAATGSSPPSRRGSSSSTGSTSTEATVFDPAVIRMEACQSLLLLWALVDALKKGINREVFLKLEDDSSEKGTSRSSTPPLMDSDDDRGETAKSHSEGTATDDIPEGTLMDLDKVKQEADATSDNAPPPMSLADRELELLTPLDTVTLLSLLQILQSVESVLLDRFMFLRNYGVTAIPVSIGERRRSSASSSEHLNAAAAAAAAAAAPSSVTLDDLECDGYILHKISLGWGFVLMLLEARNTAELKELVMEHDAIMDGRMDGFLVNSILKVLATRGVALPSAVSSMSSSESLAPTVVQPPPPPLEATPPSPRPSAPQVAAA